MKLLTLIPAKFLYRITPFRSIRELYFKLFLRLVRGRKALTTVDGMIFECDLSEMIDVGVYLQQYEPDVVATIERFCRPGWCVLDIGANIGAHTLRLAKKVGATGRVFAFEPAEYAYRKLLRNVSLNEFNNVHAFQLALSDKNIKQQTIRLRSSWPTDGRYVDGESIVDLQRLDDWCSDHHLEWVDLIKLDVDGNEFEVLNGARGLLERSRPILITEVGAWHFEDLSKNPFEILRQLDYRFWNAKSLSEYQDLNAIKKVLPARDDEMAVSINLIAAPKVPKE